MSACEPVCDGCVSACDGCVSACDGCMYACDGCVPVCDGCMSVFDGCTSVFDGCVSACDGCMSDCDGCVYVRTVMLTPVDGHLMVSLNARWTRGRVALLLCLRPPVGQAPSGHLLVLIHTLEFACFYTSTTSL